MADFLFTPDAPRFDENKNESNANAQQASDGVNELRKCATPSLTHYSTPTSTSTAPSSGALRITSPIDINLSSVSASSTPCKRALDDTNDTVSDNVSECGSEEVMSSAEKRQREQEESERLAWQLMEEESMNAYQMQVDYMRANPELFAEEDLAALGAVLQETQQREEEDVEEGEDGEEVEEDDSREWTYEQLLELGHTIGDVKTERWKMRSANVIATLPRLTFSAHKLSLNGDTTTGGKEDEEETCPVCMDCFEGPQEVAVLPCQHFFHVECCEGWLKENNSCPLCKKKITSSP